MKPDPALSQVFLKNPYYLEKITNSLEIDKKTVLEIGPGEGQLTQYLIKEAKFLYCVELDKRFYLFLTNRFSSKKNIKIIQADILKFPISTFRKKLSIVGNIPYGISKKIVIFLIKNRKLIVDAYLTVQKEFADKLAAKVATKKYGFLSCQLQYYADVKKMFDIPADSFWPQPKVDSSFMKLTFLSSPRYPVKDETSLFKLIAKVFSQRRKKVLTILKSEYQKDELCDIFSKLSIKLSSRPSDISLEKFCKLVDAFSVSNLRR